MKTSTQIYIDRVFVKPFVACLNLLVRLVGKILKIDHSLDKDFQVIAVCKFKGLGSIIQASPLLQTLRKNYPTAKIIFITTPGNRFILEKTKCVDEILCIDDSGIFKLIPSFIRLLLRLIKARIDVYIDLEIYSDFSSLLTTLSLAKNRIGYYLRSSQYRMGVYTHMMYFNTHSPIAEAYLQMARLLGCKEIIPSLILLESPLSTVLPEILKKPLKELDYILINPNASDLRIERRWPHDSFTSILKKLLHLYPDKQFFLIGNKEEAVHVQKISKHFKEEKRLKDLSGKTNLEELLALIQHASLMLTNDTGPMHIAFAAKTPTVALFGPCAPEQYGNTDRCITIYERMYCSPCVHEFQQPPCKGNNQCMQAIKEIKVMEGIENALNGQFTSTYKQNVHYKSNTRKNYSDTLGFIYRDKISQ